MTRPNKRTIPDTISRERAWLAGLSVGSKVIVQVAGVGNIPRVQSVKRFTKRQIVLKSGERFRKVDGREVGNSSGFRWKFLRQPTPELNERAKRARIISDLFAVRWEKHSTHALERVWHIVKSDTKPETEKERN